MGRWPRHRMSRLMLVALALTPPLVGACKSRRELSDIKAQPVDRRVLGKGGAYQPLPGDHRDEMARDMRERRRRAWEIVARVVREVPIAQDESLGAFRPNAPKTLPLWQTWYESDEFISMFASALAKQRDEKGRPKNYLCPDKIIGAFDDHARKKLSFRFPPERFEKRLGQLKSVEQVRGLSGTGVTLYSPGVLAHYLQNFTKVSRCQDPGRTAMPPSEDNFTHCFDSEFPSGREPLFESYLRRLRASDAERLPGCDPFDLTGPEAERAAKEIGGAVAIKTAWQRKAEGYELATFDTDADALRRHFERGEWQPDGFVDPRKLHPSEIYTMAVTPIGKTPDEDGQLGEKDHHFYQLTGMHIVTKDTRDWVWITLWWSDDPDSDFGADRPDCTDENPGVPCIGGPWRNYKMCVVSEYVELDSDPSDGFPSSLASALAAAHDLVKPHTLCSNPYIELGLGNARTNCIGCHQHAGADIDPDHVFLDDPRDPENDARRELYPFGSRAKMRVNFPGDYLWSFSHSPDFFRDAIIKVLDEADAF